MTKPARAQRPEARARAGVLMAKAVTPWLVLALVAGCGESFGPGDEGPGGSGATTSTTDTTTDTGTTTSGTVPSDPKGCADGEREGLTELEDIAACAGGFRTPGLATGPACARGGGDDAPNSSGTGCAAADLCAAGWHVCASVDEINERLGEPEACVLLSDGFYAGRGSETDGRS